VICPSLTFVATVNAIRYINAIPIFADIKSSYDLTIDPEDIEKKLIQAVSNHSIDQLNVPLVEHLHTLEEISNIERIVLIVHFMGLNEPHV
jgi:dTDP-4-amino-4,6-dideoxygalactose transaminase